MTIRRHYGSPKSQRWHRSLVHCARSIDGRLPLARRARDIKLQMRLVDFDRA